MLRTIRPKLIISIGCSYSCLYPSISRNINAQLAIDNTRLKNSSHRFAQDHLYETLCTSWVSSILLSRTATPPSSRELSGSDDMLQIALYVVQLIILIVNALW